MLEQALHVARAAGDDHGLSVATGNLGYALWDHAARRGDGEAKHRARALIEESLLVSRRAGDAWNATASAASFAEVLLADGDLPTAECLIAEARETARDSRNDGMAGWVQALEALALLKRADLTAAECRLRHAIDLIRIAVDVKLTQYALSVGAALAAASGAPLRAATLWGALDRLQHFYEPFSIVAVREEWLPPARDAVDTDAWETAWRAGARLSDDAALRLAAKTDDPE